MNKLDILTEMRGEMDRLLRERAEMAQVIERHQDLLLDVELLLREVMGHPEIWEIAPTVAQLLVRVREALAAEEPAQASE